MLLPLPVLFKFQQPASVGGNDELSVRIKINLERLGRDDELVAAHHDVEPAVCLVHHGQMSLETQCGDR